jgi:hypothetical protein
VTGKRIVQADAVFETSLGIVLVAGAATGWLDSGDFPAPIGTPVIVAVGIPLVLVGIVLWRVAVTPQLLRVLACANAATAAAALVWWLAASGFSTAGSAITLATAAALTLLAALQLLAQRRTVSGQVGVAT